MNDLLLGVLLMIAVSGLFYWFTLIVVSKVSRRLLPVWVVLVILGMIGYILFFWDKAFITWFVPYSNAIIVGNWFPVIAAVLSGLVYMHMEDEAQFRRYAMVVLLNLVGLYALLQPIIGVPPECQDRVDEFGIARQSSQVSCSPTSAVNLLKYYQIDSTESEMAGLCLTRESRSWLGRDVSDGGTSWIGLYRGLKIKLAGTEYEPRFFTVDANEFQTYIQLPVIASLMLKKELKSSNLETYNRLSGRGWIPDVEHNVVVAGIQDGIVELIDPSVGLDLLTIEDFEELYVGRGIGIRNK